VKLHNSVTALTQVGETYLLQPWFVRLKVFGKTVAMGLTLAMTLLAYPASAVDLPATTESDAALTEFVENQDNLTEDDLVALMTDAIGAQWFRENSLSGVRQVGTLDLWKVLVKPEVALNAIDSLSDTSVLANIKRARPQIAPQFGVSDPSYQANPVTITGADTVHADGFTGEGSTTAILDTGIQANHPYFKDALGNNRIVDQACFVSYPETADLPCRNGQSVDLSTDSADISYATLDVQIDYDHGTHVAGIAAGNKTNLGSQLSYVPGGMAPDADILAIRIFGSGGAYDSDILAGMDYTATNAEELNLASINLSLGYSSIYDECEDPLNALLVAEYEAGFAALIAKNVAPLVATGNDGYDNVISFPSCVPSAIAVGSTTADDFVSIFSNDSNKLDLLAPGSYIISSVPNSDFDYMSGTSMATPVVAGAWVLLHTAMPDISVAKWLTALKNTGTPIDGPIIQNMPRINVDAAMQVELVVSGPYIPSRVSASWDGFENFLLTWRAPTAGEAPTGYRVSYNGISEDVGPEVRSYSAPLADLNLTASVAVIVGQAVGQPVAEIIAPLAPSDSIVAGVSTLSSKVLVSYSLGGDYCSSVTTPTINVQYNSSTNSLRTLQLITGTGVVKTVTEQSITPPADSGFSSLRARQITLTEPEAWLTSTSKVFVANSVGMVGRALVLTSAFSGIQTALRSPQAPTNLNAVPSYESAAVTWSAGSATSWKVFVDGVSSIVTSPLLDLDLAAGSHSVDVCAYSLSGSTVYSSTKVSKTFEVLPRLTQSISATNPVSVQLSPTPLNLLASSNSGLDIDYQTLTPSICSISSSGTVVTLLSGTCTIALNQLGDEQYFAAEEQILSFAVVRPTPTAIVSPKWSIKNLTAKLTWGTPLNASLANVTSYVLQWRVALPKKSFGSWKTKALTSRAWTSLKYKKFTKIQVRVYARGAVANSPVFTSVLTVK
jgi:subtilisin family serine protease